MKNLFDVIIPAAIALIIMGLIVLDSLHIINLGF